MKKTREQINAEARERMAEYRKTPEFRVWFEQSRELRRALKEKYRRAAGARPRQEIADEAAKRRAQAAQRMAMRSIHDAHVKKYWRVIKSRSKVKEWYAVNADKKRAYVIDRRDALTDAYVVQNLKSMGIEPNQITENLVSLKREAMQFRRLVKKAKTAISNHLKESHETVPKHA